MTTSAAHARPPHDSPVSRGRPTPLLVAALFALVTGAGLLHVAASVPMPAPVVATDRESAANRQVAWRFYVALDAALATGDASQVRAAVAPGFVDHQPGTTMAGAAGLVHEVAALRRTSPHVRLSAEALVVDGDVVLAYVSTRGAGPDSATDQIPLAAPATRDTIELVRIAGGVVAERWVLSVAPDGVAVLEATPSPEPASSPAAPLSAADDPLCGATFCT